jgi:diguanylate cyclase (GGDEF)-like protein
MVTKAQPHFRYSLLLKEIDNMRSTDGVMSVALALIHLDGMDQVNESFGYLGGDKVLKEFAVRLSAIVGHRGSMFEIGGTSYALLIENPKNEADAARGAEKIAKAAADPVAIGTGKAQVTAKMGISMFPNPAATAEELLCQAEIAIDQARQSGDAYRVFTPDLSAADGFSTKSWFDVNKAIKQHEFEIHYQPKIDLRSGRPIGTEALIRWKSPQSGTIRPGYFLPNITSPEGVRMTLLFMLDNSLDCAARWLEKLPDFSLAVNLAPNNLKDPELAGIIKSTLEIKKFPADRLILEVLESVLIEEDEMVINQLSSLREIGVRIAIDDFGKGNLGLMRLRSLPIDQLKIDKDFIESIASNEMDRRLVGAVIQMADALGLEVVAEGIENAEAMQTLIAAGCEVGEGYHFCQPLSESEFEKEWVEKFSRSSAESA